MKIRTISKAGASLALVLVLSSCVEAAVSTAGSTALSVAQERSVGAAIDDATIRASVNSNYIQKDVNELFHAIHVEVHEGRVLLTGRVKTPEHRVQAVKLAWQVKGVREVINEIRVGENMSDKNLAKRYTEDAWITAQVKARILFKKKVNSVNYTVDTVDGVVYMMGIAQDEAELESVLEAARRVKGVKKVVSHVILKNDPARR